jgi:hypothetical protein
MSVQGDNSTVLGVNEVVPVALVIKRTHLFQLVARGFQLRGIRVGGTRQELVKIVQLIKVLIIPRQPVLQTNTRFPPERDILQERDVHRVGAAPL